MSPLENCTVKLFCIRERTKEQHLLSNLHLFELSHTYRFVDWLIAARGDKLHGGDLELAGQRDAGGGCCQELAARLPGGPALYR